MNSRSADSDNQELNQPNDDSYANTINQKSANAREATSSILRLAFQITAFYFGILVPIAILAIASGGALSQNSDRWQSGELKTFALLLLEMPETLPAIPLILAAMVALAAVEVRPKASRSLALRATIYLGVLVSFQYLGYSMIASMFFPVLIGGVLTWPAVFAISYLFVWSFRKLSRIMVLTAVIAILLSLGFNLQSDNFVSGAVVWFLFGSAFGGPFGCFVTYWLTARRIYLEKYPEPTLRTSIVVWGSAATAWFAATTGSIMLMLNKYSQLPLTRPNDCFVCSAAAYGHKQIVLSQPVVILGQVHMINHQLQRLKFLEIVLLAAFPSLHRMIRGVYNRIGPMVALPARRNRWYADVCYLILKPLEGFAVFVQNIARIPQSKIDSIYIREAEIDL
ncbi:MAG: hypothetical protein NTW52_15870 [Planctomycetota bacterium]|nr:hypothetical protein [Planctomycetota bacterium]